MKNSDSPTTQTTTDFGYQQVPVAEKSKKVADVFHSVAEQYDIMNDLMSLGIHRIWKQFTIDVSGVKEGHSVLDIAGGTGDLTAKFAKRVGCSGRVYLADINASMLQIGKRRLLDEGLIDNIFYLQANAESLPFNKNSFDCISIAFGLRNVTDKTRALQSMYHVLKPGGQLLILEFSKPVISLLQQLYDAYSFSVLPRLGAWITNDADSYQYLVESIRVHPDQNTLKTMMMTAGFEQCSYHNLCGGIVALHRGYKF